VAFVLLDRVRQRRNLPGRPRGGTQPRASPSARRSAPAGQLVRQMLAENLVIWRDWAGLIRAGIEVLLALGPERICRASTRSRWIPWCSPSRYWPAR
jgi:hypothetical protein